MVSPPGASDFANSGKVTKTPFGNQGFQNLPLPVLVVLPAFAGASWWDAAQTRAAAADVAVVEGCRVGAMRAGATLTLGCPRKKARQLKPARVEI